MQSIRQVARLNEAELEKVVPPNASWHTDYRDTAYIYIGGLPFELSEGDILTIFSQYGNPTDVKLVRDRETGKSRGFAFLKYEDQRSCDLAVDNLSGGGVLGRVMSVDHTRYKKKDGEIETVGDEIDEGDETDREGVSHGKRRRRSESGSESEDERPRLREEVELAKLMAEHDADDPMKAYLIDQKKAEVQEALRAVAKKPVVKPKKHRHRHRRSEDDGRTKQQSPKSNGSRLDRERSREKHRRRRERSESSSSSHDDRHRRPR